MPCTACCYVLDEEKSTRGSEFGDGESWGQPGLRKGSECWNSGAYRKADTVKASYTENRTAVRCQDFLAGLNRSSLTNLDEGVIAVARFHMPISSKNPYKLVRNEVDARIISKEPIREERDDRVHGRHVQNSLDKT